jgi:DNA-binding beta-propeller fold protein YncE
MDVLLSRRIRWAAGCVAVAGGLLAVLSGAGSAAAYPAAVTRPALVTHPEAVAPERIFAAFNDSVADIDPATGAVKVTDEHLGISDQGPYLLVATPDGKTVYLINSATGEVVPYSGTTGQPGKPIHVTRPQVAVLAPDGTMYVGGKDTVTPISTATDKAGAPINVHGDVGSMAVTPNGRTLYVGDGNNGDVLPISTATNTPGTPIHLAAAGSFGMANGQGLAITPDGKTLWALDGANAVIPISIATGTKGTPVELSAVMAVAITPSGTTAYVVRNGNGFAAVTPLNLATHKAEKSIPVPQMADWITMSASGRTAYVGYLGGPVIPISTATGVKGPYFGWSQLTMALALAPSGTTAYTCGYRGVIPVSTTTDTLDATLYVPPLSNAPQEPCSAIVVTP